MRGYEAQDSVYTKTSNPVVRRLEKLQLIPSYLPVGNRL